MGIFDFFRKNDEHREIDKPDSKQGQEAMNPVSRERDQEQAAPGQVSAAGAEKSFKPKDRHPIPSHEYYEVQEGDSLSAIANKRYGDPNKWKMIYEANKNKIKDPDFIQPGQMIELPDIHKEK